MRDPADLEIVGSDERNHNDKTYRVIFGKSKDGDGSVEQAYRYPKDTWSEETVAPFPQPYWELLLSFAVALVPIAIVVWDHEAATKAELEMQATGQSGT